MQIKDHEVEKLSRQSAIHYYINVQVSPKARPPEVPMRLHRYLVAKHLLLNHEIASASQRFHG